jgi:hypothetical protein
MTAPHDIRRRLANAGRRITQIIPIDLAPHRGRFERAKARLQARCRCRIREIDLLFHTTSTAAGESIVASGFRVGHRVGAFGVGVNLSPSLEHTLLYASNGACCTLVCRAAVGRWHANRSREVPGHEDTQPDFRKPKSGYDAMFGEGGLIVVIPSAARVQPYLLILHEPK